jgi:hypothetical protein
MMRTLAKRIRHDEELLKNTSQSLLESGGVMWLAMLAFLVVCACILLLGR